MNILLVENLLFTNIFKQKGHKVFTVSKDISSDFPIEKYNYQLSKICKNYNIDVLLQVESLGERLTILDINQINVLKIYYAIDIHLNYYWQKEYKEYFHIFISSQKNISDSIWLPWGVSYDRNIKFKPFNKRKYDLSFIGLIDENRIKRKNIITEIKKKYNILIKGDKLNNRVPYEETIEIYNNSKIVLNESINNEINFRYFEATFSGAMLFTEEINNGEDELFIIDKEIVTFNQNNLFEKLDFYMNNLDIAEQIAYNGYKKTFKMHTLEKRVDKLLDIIGETNVKKITYIKNDKLTKSLFLTKIRGISGNSFFYLKNIENDLFSKLVKFYIKKATSPLEALALLLDFLTKEYDDLIYFNIIALTVELNLKERFSDEQIFEIAIRIIKSLIKKGYCNMQGFMNVSKISIILTGIDIVNFLYDYFPDKAIKSKELNLLAAKILMNSNNFQGAIFYLLNNIRNYPDNLLTRKYLAECYYKIFSIELFMLETLKILILEKNFLEFKKYNADIETKLIAILDIIKHSQDKKLLRDISLNLSEYF